LFNVGIIGTNFGGTVHLPAFLKMPGFNVIALCDNGSGKAKELIDIHNLDCEVFMNHSQLIRSNKINLIDIVCPTFLHSKLLKECLNMKKHVICEKPYGLNFKDIKGIASKMNKQKLINVVNYEFRFENLMNELKKIISNSSFGKICKLEIEWNLQKKNRDGWKENAKKGGGVFNELLCHVIDYINFLLNINDFKQFSNPNLLKVTINRCVLNFKIKDINISIKIIRKGKDFKPSHTIKVYGNKQLALLKYNFPFDSKSKELLLGDSKSMKKINNNNYEYFSDDRVKSFCNILKMISDVAKAFPPDERNDYLTKKRINFSYAEQLRSTLDILNETLFCNSG